MNQIDEDKNKLPENWVKTTISDIVELNPKHPAGLDDKLEISFIPMQAVDDKEGVIAWPESKKLGEVKKGYTHFSENDVIFAKITPCMENGKAAVAKGLQNGIACGSTEFYVFRSRGSVVPEFLYRFLRQEAFRQAAKSEMTGAVGQARVPKDFLLKTEINLPPFSEQRRIVAKLEELFARTRAIRESLQAIPKLIEQFRQSVLAAAFRGDLTREWREAHPDVEPASVLLERIRAERRACWEAAELAKMRAKGKEPLTDHWKEKYQEPEPVDNSELPELPEGWEWVTLEEISDPIRAITYGVVLLGEEHEGGIPILRSSNVRHLQLDLSVVKTINPEIAKQYQRTFLEGGEILITVRGTLGGIVVAPDSCKGFNISREVALIAPIEKDICDSLTLLIGSPWLNAWLMKNTKGIAYTGINIETLKKMPVPLPPKNEQFELSKVVNNLFGNIQKIFEEIDLLDSQLNKQEQSILSKAFRGELVPQDPDDEPASILLERIRGTAKPPAAAEKPAKPAKAKLKQGELFT